MDKGNEYEPNHPNNSNAYQPWLKVVLESDNTDLNYEWCEIYRSITASGNHYPLNQIKITESINRLLLNYSGYKGEIIERFRFGLNDWIVYYGERGYFNEKHQQHLTGVLANGVKNIYTWLINGMGEYRNPNLKNNIKEKGDNNSAQERYYEDKFVRELAVQFNERLARAKGSIEANKTDVTDKKKKEKIDYEKLPFKDLFTHESISGIIEQYLIKMLRATEEEGVFTYKGFQINSEKINHAPQLADIYDYCLQLKCIKPEFKNHRNIGITFCRHFGLSNTNPTCFNDVARLTAMRDRFKVRISDLYRLLKQETEKH